MDEMFYHAYEYDNSNAIMIERGLRTREISMKSYMWFDVL